MITKRAFSYCSGLFLTGFLLLNSCTKSVVDDSAPALGSKQFAKDKEFLTSLGYDTRDLMRLDTCYIVEGDIYISDHLLTDIRNGSQTRHTYSQWPYTVNEKNRKIRIGIEGSSSDRTIVLEALKYWNEEIKCGLYFLEDTPGDIKIEFVSSTNPAGGVETTMPPTSDGKPGSKISIFYQSTAYFQANNTQKKYLIVHALGHAVGFGHTPATLAEYNAIAPGSQIKGTVDYDPKSIMVKPASTLKWSGISNFDKDTFLKIYPYTAPSLSMDWSPYDPKFICNKTYTYRAYYTNDLLCPNPEFKFTVTSESSEPARYQIKSNGVLQILFPTHGTYRIKVAVTNAPSQPEVAEVVSIYDDTPTLAITPTETIEVGKTYRISMNYDNPDVGKNPIYNFKITDTKFGNKAEIKKIDNKSIDVIFTHPGNYEIKATHSSDATKSAILSLNVYTQKITIENYQEPFYTGERYIFKPEYYTEKHTDPKFKYSVYGSDITADDYELHISQNNEINIVFKKPKKYIIRIEIDGATDIYTEYTFDIQQSYPKLVFETSLDSIQPCQRVSFRADWNGIGYNKDRVTITVVDMRTGESIPVIYDEGYYRYYFFTQNLTNYKISIADVNNPSLSSDYLIYVKPGIFLKLVTTGVFKYNDNIDVINHNIYFYKDKDCLYRINLPYDITIRVHLFKKAVDLYPNDLHIYRDVTFPVVKGSPDICRQRLVTIHERLPSGATLDDYYEIEIVNISQ